MMEANRLKRSGAKAHSAIREWVLRSGFVSADYAVCAADVRPMASAYFR